MSEKVTVTPEEDIAIKKVRKDGRTDEEILEVAFDPENFWLTTEPYHPLNRMDKMKLNKALINGYEVAEEFEEGDWVYLYDYFTVNQIRYIDGVGRIYLKDSPGDGLNLYKREIRHATEHEIIVAKETRWWNDRGRKYREYKEEDIVHYNGEVMETINFMSDLQMYNGECFYPLDTDNMYVVCLNDKREDKAYLDFN